MVRKVTNIIIRSSLQAYPIPFSFRLVCSKHAFSSFRFLDVEAIHWPSKLRRGKESEEDTRRRL